MLWVPQKGVVRVEHNTGTTGAQIGTPVTTGGAADTKGTPEELIASTAFDSYWMTVIASAYGSSATACQGSMDILVGAATEDVLIADLLMGYCGGNTAAQMNGPKVWNFPLYVPAGTRIACQAAGADTSTTFRVGIFLHGGNGYPPFRVGSKVTTYGMGTVPNGTTITVGASGAEGGYAQITAATSEDHFAFVPSFQTTGDTTINNRILQVDIGIGAATEEEIGSWWYYTNAVEQMGGPWNPLPAFQDVPSGTRLAMRASCNSTVDGGYNGVIHAVSA